MVQDQLRRARYASMSTKSIAHGFDILLQPSFSKSHCGFCFRLPASKTMTWEAKPVEHFQLCSSGE
jgi:hypothetical protein